MSMVIRKYIPISIMVFVGAILFIDYFFVTPNTFVIFAGEIQQFNIVIAGFAMLLASIRVFEYHGRRILNKEPGQWLFSLWLCMIVLTMLIVGLYFGVDSFQLNWLYNMFFKEPSSAVYSLIGWILFYAIYISFRLTSPEMLYFTVVWSLALLGNSPIGTTIWSGFPELRSWIELVPNTAATRGYYIANTLSAIVIGFRTLAGRTSVGLGE